MVYIKKVVISLGLKKKNFLFELKLSLFWCWSDVFVEWLVFFKSWVLVIVVFVFVECILYDRGVYCFSINV